MADTRKFRKGGDMSSKKGFTLLELIIVVIVIGVLATIAIPQYTKAVERAKGGKATSNLNLIRQAEHLYRANNDKYIAISNSNTVAGAGTEFSASDLNDYIELIGVDKDEDWIYSVTVDNAAVPQTFTAQAKRDEGPYAGATITIDQDGKITK